MKRQAFTLIEFVAIMALIMIIASIAIPNYTHIVDRNRLKADAATALEIAKISEAYYAESKENATDNVKLQGYVQKVYGGDLPTPQYDKNGSFSLSLNNNGKATVTLVSSIEGGNLVLVNQGKFQEPDLTSKE